jgi:hypothetical protein
VHVADRGDARSDVEELPDTRADEELHRPPQEVPVRPGRLGHVGRHLRDLLGELPVDLEVVRATEVVVVDAGRAGTRDVEVSWSPFG